MKIKIYCKKCGSWRNLEELELIINEEPQSSEGSQSSSLKETKT